MSSGGQSRPGTVVISGIGVHCVAGDEPVGVWSAATLNLCVAAPVPDVLVPAGGGKEKAAPLAAAIGEFAGAGINERLGALVRRAAARLPLAGADPARVGIFLGLPPAGSIRRSYVVEQSLIEACMNQWPQLPAANIHLIDTAEGATASLLMRGWDAVRKCECDYAVVGAVDTLVNEETFLELSGENRLMTERDTAGVIPGEGGAFLLLEPEAQARGRQAAIRAGLAAIAHVREPHPGAADLHPVSGLPEAIQAALGQAGLAPKDVDGLVLAMGREPSDHAELYQTTQRLWPWKIDERQRLAMELGELEPDALELPDDPVPRALRTSAAFGELGAATVPMQLLLGVEWFAAERRDALWGIEPQRRHLLVCETGTMHERGAIVLSAPTAGNGA